VTYAKQPILLLCGGLHLDTVVRHYYQAARLTLTLPFNVGVLPNLPKDGGANAYAKRTCKTHW
jgi:hypothetical protein